jgi:aspartyl protease family protein
MATGFMLRACAGLRILRVMLITGIVPAAFAADVTVVGLFPGKAVLIINGSAPRTVSVGQSSPEGVKLLSTDGKTVTLEVEGKKRVLEMGEHFATAVPGSVPTVTLSADTRGHFVAQGSVNGGSVRFLVDTGATVVALPARDAIRLGIDYRRGEAGVAQTAAGNTPVYRVRLDTVRIGDVTLNQVDGIVIEGGLEVALLGMSFLNRTEMKREGQVMTLTKRF